MNHVKMAILLRTGLQIQHNFYQIPSWLFCRHQQANTKTHIENQGTYNRITKIISKKNHACGGNEWVIVRTGADIKLKCSKCGRAVFVSVDQLKKITKIYIPVGKDD